MNKDDAILLGATAASVAAYYYYNRRRRRVFLKNIREILEIHKGTFLSYLTFDINTFHTNMNFSDTVGELVNDSFIEYIMKCFETWYDTNTSATYNFTNIRPAPVAS